jgi:hypothetical protein
VNLLHRGTRTNLTGSSPGVRELTPASTLEVFDPDQPTVTAAQTGLIWRSSWAT